MSRGIAEQLAVRIEQWIGEEHIAEGTPLPERALAERFRVSRTPVREALQLLQRRNAIRARPEGGYAVASTAMRAGPLAALPPADADEHVYLQLAEDRLAGRVPQRISENELVRRYGLTRARLAPVLRRIASEGWIERLPGHGWEFSPILDSADAYDQGYRMRILLEPAALLEPGFCIDRAELERCRAEQQALADGAAEWASPSQLFDANVRLHETLLGFSGNVFMLDALRRINRLRRLIEYGKAVDREASARRSREHLTLIDLLLSGQREAAADFLRLHLRDAAREKSETRTSGE